MLLNIPQCTGQLAQQRKNWPQMAKEPQYQNPQVAGRHETLELNCLGSNPSSTMEQLYNLQ